MTELPEYLNTALTALNDTMAGRTIDSVSHRMSDGETFFRLNFTNGGYFEFHERLYGPLRREKGTE